MTAIEFYDSTPLENAISSLTAVPEKIIFLGDGKAMKKFGCNFEKFLAKRDLSHVVLDYKSVNRNNLNNLVETLCKIVEEEQSCLFDLTGGDDLALVAMGIVYEKYRSTGKIQMQRLNVNSGVIYDCDNDGNLIAAATPALTVEQNIILHGGVVRYNSLDKVCTRLWDFNDEFRRDVDEMWKICRKNPACWNNTLNLLSLLEGDMEQNDDLDCELVAVAADSVVYQNKSKTFTYKFRDFLRSLEKADIIFGYHEDDEVLTFVYKSLQVKKCLAKAGTLLELKVCSTASLVEDNDGKPFYSDAMAGVFIDWDGELHDRLDDESDTENEIDVILMRGVTPVFISCKNGAVDDEELYKFETVASRFGGRYARKVLIATYLGKGADSMEHFRQRAKDMHIEFIEGVHTLEEPEFIKMLKNIMSNK